MKYLSDYIEDKQTALFEKTGAFFAFGNDQLKEKAQPDTKYVSMGVGLICPKANAKELDEGLNLIHQQGIAEDIKENGIKAIIHRELGNHEAQITYDIDDTLMALGGYGITEEQVQAEFPEFMKVCEENDWF